MIKETSLNYKFNFINTINSNKVFKIIKQLLVKNLWESKVGRRGTLIINKSKVVGVLKDGFHPALVK